MSAELQQDSMLPIKNSQIMNRRCEKTDKKHAQCRFNEDIPALEKLMRASANEHTFEQDLPSGNTV